MRPVWAARLNAEDWRSAGRLRMDPHVEVCVTPDALWVRGPECSDASSQSLRTLNARRYDILADGQLREVGRIVPSGRLPDGPWTALQTAIVPLLPTSRWPAGRHQRESMRLVRSDEMKPASVLLCQWSDWEAYALSAPEIRLNHCRFAVRIPVETGDQVDISIAKRSVIIHGQPLPGIAGRHFFLDEGIAVPSGFRWSPPVSARLLKAKWELQRDDVLLWQGDGRPELIRGDQFVRVTRSAVRATGRAIRGQSEASGLDSG